MRAYLILLLTTFLCTCGLAQDITISGYLLSEHDSEPLSFANIYAQNSGVGAIADSTGYFELSGLAAGPELLSLSHIGCDPEQRAILLRRDTQLTVYLHHHDNYVETITVAAKAYERYGETLDNQATEDLADGLEQLTGVSTLRTGTAAAKPVYDGLSGNRLSIQNNGVAQAGQQWGNDHSPEIDPWIAAYVRVVEGVEALRYGGPTAGATVLIEPAPLRETEDFSGKAAYTFQSNGLGNVLNARISNGGKTAYRLSLTGKARGDQSAPDYFLRNTGRREADAALQLARFHNDRWTSRLYLSTYNAEIGVLRGSHIGNLTDLELAFDRDEPFFTEDELIYSIDNPRQVVHHHLAKAETEYRPNDDNRFRLTYAVQANDRKEFDVRRGDRDDRPALDLLQVSQFVEGSYHRELGPGRHLDANVQYEYVDNDNVPGTGIQPLIPNYNGLRGSGYVAYHQEYDLFQVHGGLRYDHQYYEAKVTSRGSREVEIFTHNFSGLSGSVEGRYQVADKLSLRAGVTLRTRAPQINELYSAGLHQGVSGIEEGDASLGNERSAKFSLSGLWSDQRFGINGTVFYQPIDGYILLEPQEELRLTIRGAFPVFRYRGTDAVLYGVNLQAYYQLNDGLKISGALAQVQGKERENNRPLVFIPPLNFRGGLRYEPKGWWTGWSFDAGVYVSAEQTRLENEQDFRPPPPGYTLLDLAVARRWELAGGRGLNLRARVDNALNTRYRDYLDRQRYFADAPGVDVELGISYEF